jgi:hypothetical protein
VHIRAGVIMTGQVLLYSKKPCALNKQRHLTPKRLKELSKGRAK